MRKKLITRMEDFLSCRLAEEQRPGRLRWQAERPSVTISRQAGTGGLEIGMKLVDYLAQFDETAEHGWALFDQSLVARVIEDRRLPGELTELPVRAPSSGIPLPIIEGLRKSPSSQWTLLQHSVATIRRLCLLGNVVVLGRGANFITRDLPNTFHVRLVSPRSEPSEEPVQSHDRSIAEFAEWRHSTDRARADYVERQLGCRIDDPTAYHVTINTGRYDGDSTARLIGDALLEWACSRTSSTAPR